MNSREFIYWCYRELLFHEPERQALERYSSALDHGKITRSDILRQFSACDERLRLRQHYASGREFVPAGHFYSAVPSDADREAFLTSEPNSDVRGIDLNRDRQHELLKTFCREYYPDQPFGPKPANGLRYGFENLAYSYGDGLILHCMIRHVKPRRIVEIGSGYSSCVLLDTNDLFFNSESDLTFIEPYPQLLDSLLKKGDHKRITIHPAALQEVDLSVFAALEPNDILLVDSTHVSKLGSDVNRVFFDLIPILRPGVVVHVHDVFWPFEYPCEWVEEGRAWNELYVLRAFLQYNSDFEILYFADLMFSEQGDWIRQHMPLIARNSGGSFWMRRM